MELQEGKRMNVFREMIASMFQPAAYPEFLKNKKGKIFGYGILLVTFYYLLSSPLFSMLSFQFVDGGFGRIIQEELPDFELSSDGFWVEESVYQAAGGTLLYLDTDVNWEQREVEDIIREYDTVIFMDSRKLYIKSEGQTMHIFCNELGNDVFDKDSIMKFMPLMYLIMFLILLLYYIGVALTFFFGVLVVSLAGMILASITKAPLSFGRIYILALYGRTLPLLIKGILRMASVHIPMFWVLNFGATLLYMFFAMRRIAQQEQQFWGMAAGYGPGGYSQNPYGQGSYGQGGYNQGSYGPDGYSQGSYSQNPYGQGSGSSNPYGQDGSGQDSSGEPRL